MLKKRLLACAVASVAGLMMSSAANAITVQLTLQIDQAGPQYAGAGADGPGTHTWDVYAQLVSDGVSNTSITSGLASFGFDVTGTGTVVLAGLPGYTGATTPPGETTFNDAPLLSSGTFSGGFNTFPTIGTAGIGIGGAQPTTAYKIKSATGSGSTVKNLILGIGLSAGSSALTFDAGDPGGSGSIAVPSWGVPILLAEGTFTATGSGAITVSADPASFLVLPNTLPTATTGGVTVTPLAVDFATGATVPVGAIPEPASLAVLGLGLAAFAARRRRKTA